MSPSISDTAHRGAVRWGGDERSDGLRQMGSPGIYVCVVKTGIACLVWGWPRRV
ncbi:hypothetical protein BDZ94DRAFT_1275091 [Collybia nuda]|uniref:Uncharacterized protein n=1 Tax=Collybia nuda TaxID=64659 RepID=A0A9P5XTX0_9AGAR|nr:hypothetical protein BDZ94DRAFT_1275091 [Collybia nuda]